MDHFFRQPKGLNDLGDSRVGGDVDLVTQVRKLRKYLAVWLSED